MYKIKQIPEDFFVKEISNVKVGDKGRFSYFLLKKKNYTTVRAIEKIAKKLGILPKKISFAGTKDRNAITEQVVSIVDGTAGNMELKDIELKFLSKGDEPVSLGDLEGNYFEVVIRDLNKNEIEKIKGKKTSFVNYFGEQRFSKNNKEIGKFILKKDFEKAVKLILKNEGDYEKKVKEYLENKKGDFVGSLRQIPKKILKFYVHAYQSWLWNCIVEEFIKNKNQKIPLVGFGTELRDDKLGKIIKNKLKKENIVLRDFIIKQIPELSSEGNERDLLIEVKDFKILEQGEDELNKGKFKVKISFSLPKGSYATVFIENL